MNGAVQGRSKRDTDTNLQSSQFGPQGWADGHILPATRHETRNGNRGCRCRTNRIATCECTADRSDLSALCLAALCRGMDSSYFLNTHHLPQLKVCMCRTGRSAGRTSFVKSASVLIALWVEQECLEGRPKHSTEWSSRCANIYIPTETKREREPKAEDSVHIAHKIIWKKNCDFLQYALNIQVGEPCFQQYTNH